MTIFLTWAQPAGRRGKCDRCHVGALALYHIGHGASDLNADRTRAYCEWCALDIMRASDQAGRLLVDVQI